MRICRKRQGRFTRQRKLPQATTGPPLRQTGQGEAPAFKVSGMPVTTAELTRTYAGSMGMGPPGAPAPDQTLLAAILETAKGNLFRQLPGPRATVAANRGAFLSMVRGIKKH